MTNRIFLFAFAFLFTAGTANAAVTIEQMPYATKPVEGCNVKVDLGSTSNGIDRSAYLTVQHTVQLDPDIDEARVYPTGKEGEVTFCLMAPSEKNQTVFNRLKDALPEKIHRGYLTVTYNDQNYYVTTRKLGK